MSAIWAAGLLLRRLRTELGVATLIVLLVGATSFVFAAAPRLLGRTADDALRFAVRVAQPLQRDIALNLDDQIPGGPSGIEQVRRTGDTLIARVPASIEGLASSVALRITSPRLSLLSPPAYDTRLALTFRDGIEDASRLVDGRWPVDVGQPLRTRELGEPPADGPPPEPVIVEVAISRAAADDVGLRVGDRVAVALDGSDGLVRFQRVQLRPTNVEIVGVYEPIDVSATFWAGDDDLVRAVAHGSDPDTPVAFVGAVIAEAAYPRVSSMDLRFHFVWRLRVDPERLHAADAEALQADLRRLGQAGNNSANGRNLVTIVTGLPVIIGTFVEQRAATESILSLAIVGPFGLAGGALAMVALLLAGRRRPALTLARGRGASGSLVLGTQLWEAALLAGGAAVLGYLAANMVLPGPPDPRSIVLSAGVGLGAIGLLLLAAWPAARQPLGQLERDDAPVLRVPPRRLVLEATVVGIAIGAALLLRERGLQSGSGEADSVVRGDPLLASVPALSGLAAGIVALRLYPLPVRALGWLAARGRGFVPVVALRTISRHSAGSNLPLLVLLLTAAFGTFTSVVATSLDRGQLAASYYRIGADYRLENALGGVLPPSLDPAAVPGVEAAAPGLIDTSAPLGDFSTQSSSVYLEAVDPVAFAAVNAGTPAAPEWPAEFLEPFSRSDLGTSSNPIPAIVSNRAPTGSASLAVGTVFRMEAARSALLFRVVQRRATFAGIDERVPFAVVPYDQVTAAAGHFVSPDLFWLRGGPEVRTALAAAVKEARGNARIIARLDTYANLHDAPLVRAITAGFLLAVALAAAYMGFTIIGEMVLSTARRTRDHAFLRTLGVSSGQRLALTMAEHAPPVLLGLIPGAALGVAIAVLVEPGLNLTTFTGGSRAPLVVDWPGLAILLAGLLATVVIAVGGGSLLASRARVTDALRIGEH